MKGLHTRNLVVPYLPLTLQLHTGKKKQESKYSKLSVLRCKALQLLDIQRFYIGTIDKRFLYARVKLTHALLSTVSYRWVKQLFTPELELFNQLS